MALEVIRPLISVLLRFNKVFRLPMTTVSKRNTGSSAEYLARGPVDQSGL